MPSKSQRHLATQWTMVSDMPRDRMNISLADARDAVRRSRRTADTFHSYDTTSRDGAPIHVVYAHYLPCDSYNGHAVTYVFVIATEAVLASFGLAPPTMAATA